MAKEEVAAHKHADLEKELAALKKEVAALKKDLAAAKKSGGGADPRVDKILEVLKTSKAFKSHLES
jgi:outer membrane murein-binding lipoprotein Lpp